MKVSLGVGSLLAMTPPADDDDDNARHRRSISAALAALNSSFRFAARISRALLSLSLASVLFCSARFCRGEPFRGRTKYFNICRDLCFLLPVFSFRAPMRVADGAREAPINQCERSQPARQSASLFGRPSGGARTSMLAFVIVAAAAASGNCFSSSSRPARRGAA